jgi:hypothetical protein
MRLTHRHLTAAFAALLYVTAVGCGPGKSTVTGKVTLDGKPLSAGTIVFIPARGPAVSAEVKGGQYSVAGVPNGEAKVTVDNTAVKALIEAGKKANTPMGRASLPPTAKGPPPGTQLTGPAKEGMDKQRQAADEAARVQKELIANYRPIPDKYNAAASSGLTFKVGSGSTFDIELSSK